MRSYSCRTLAAWACVLAACLSSKLHAQAVTETLTAESGSNLPDGKSIYESFLEKTGGQEARSQLNTQKITGALKMSTPQGEISAPMLICQARPNRFALEVDFSALGIGKMMQGTNGDIAWDVNPMTGARILKGDDRERMLKQADIDGSAKSADNFASIDCVATEEIDDHSCFKVEFTPKEDGAEIEVRFFDIETGLLVRSISKQKTMMGNLDVVSNVSDYREVAGLKLPFRTEIVVRLPIGEQKQVMEFEKIEVNGELGEEVFAIPEPIQEKLQKEAERDNEAATQ